MNIFVWALVAFGTASSWCHAVRYEVSVPGGDLLLRCDATSANNGGGPLIIQWWLNEQPLPTEIQHFTHQGCEVVQTFMIIGDRGIGTLQFQNIAESCNGTLAQCQATYEQSQLNGTTRAVICEARPQARALNATVSKGNIVMSWQSPLTYSNSVSYALTVRDATNRTLMFYSTSETVYSIPITEEIALCLACTCTIAVASFIPIIGWGSEVTKDIGWDLEGHAVFSNQLYSNLTEETLFEIVVTPPICFVIMKIQSVLTDRVFTEHGNVTNTANSTTVTFLVPTPQMGDQYVIEVTLMSSAGVHTHTQILNGSVQVSDEAVGGEQTGTGHTTVVVVTVVASVVVVVVVLSTILCCWRLCKCCSYTNDTGVSPLARRDQLSPGQSDTPKCTDAGNGTTHSESPTFQSGTSQDATELGIIAKPSEDSVRKRLQYGQSFGRDDMLYSADQTGGHIMTALPAIQVFSGDNAAVTSQPKGLDQDSCLESCSVHGAEESAMVVSKDPLSSSNESNSAAHCEALTAFISSQKGYPPKMFCVSQSPPQPPQLPPAARQVDCSVAL